MKFTGVDLANGGAGVAFEGLFPDGTEPGKLIYLTFPFEGVYPESSRFELVDYIFDFFNGIIDDLPSAGEQQVVREFKLLQNYPNPFNPDTRISFSLPQSGPVNLVIYNVLGEKIVQLLENAAYKSGDWEITWNGTNGHGQKMPSGIYFYALTDGKHRQVRKMILAK